MAERQPPLLLFRGDTRSPDIIFKEGFVAKGGLDGVIDLIAHVKGGENLKKTGLISTSQSLRIPPIFMGFAEKDGGYDQKLGFDGKVYIRRLGWIYHIKTSPDLKMVYIPDFLTDVQDPDCKPAVCRHQQEWAVHQAIPARLIKGGQRFDGYVRNQDLLDGRGPFTITLPEEGAYHEFVDNPNYAP